MNSIKISMMVVGVCLLAACSQLGVQPWERDLLADPRMELQGNEVDKSFDDHIYFSKEATSGGRGSAAGGCGCN
ncbi:DUF4266 domain-containing protein [Vibrio algarum]|uniref:DUF4266 domain-containing protein n=1 Tax=Vibrio algarum TaxID=3020714 RepID=A0ABT4YW66_9VIBR|nr:DUF4266 domain-containing protein [Vibrio sp. KJ40-1]MDB1125827.1 DUF4266 domain-containing protein [Vibrio sp. KJ40-1]